MEALLCGFHIGGVGVGDRVRAWWSVWLLGYMDVSGVGGMPGCCQRDTRQKKPVNVSSQGITECVGLTHSGRGSWFGRWGALQMERLWVVCCVVARVI
jgi:hypothetical protein